MVENDGSTVFGYYVNDPERYGVIEFDNSGKVISIEEKPKKTKIPIRYNRLYVYDNSVVELQKNLNRRIGESWRLQITDVNLKYLKRNKLHVEVIGRGVACLDTGTHESLLEAAHFVSTLEKRQGLKFGCPEETALRMGFVDEKKLIDTLKPLPACPYKKHIENILKEKVKTWEVSK